VNALRIIAENRITTALENGEFDNLAGLGKPLPLNPQWADNDENFLANHLLKNNGFLPDWLEERKILLEEIETLHQKQIHTENKTGEIIESILDLNRKISGYNLRVPVASMQLRLIPNLKLMICN
jgi:hypothetical protein